MMNHRGRRASSDYVELHVLCVPLELWNSKLNTISSEVIDNFISAGLIRVYPDITLKTLRDELGVLLGDDICIDKYSFLKCVGRCLALVKPRQERELKVKAFSPPYAPHPELYLLPCYTQPSGSTRSLSHSSEIQSSSSNPRTSFRSDPSISAVVDFKEPVRFPDIKQASNQPPALSLDDDEEEEDDDDDDDGGGADSIISSEEKEEDGSSYNSVWGDSHSQKDIHQQLQTKKGKEISNKLPPGRETVHSASRRPARRRIQTKDSGATDCVEDADSGLSLSQDRKYRDNKNNRIKKNAKESAPTMASSFIITARKPLASVFSTNRQELIEEIRLLREERRQLERIRQDLLRKGKDLLALNRHRRNQARNGWKRKYFDTKKATAPLEESLKNVRQELETYYHKLLQQLQAREGRNKHKRLGKASNIKNDLIIQIMTETYEIDDLRRKVEDSKMKLETEQKLKVQAATELKTLKAELASKKSNFKHPEDALASRQQHTGPAAEQKQV